MQAYGASIENNWIVPRAPLRVGGSTSGTSGSYTAADSVLGVLHSITAATALLVVVGTTAPTAASTGCYVAAGERLPFVPTTANPSIAWIPVDGAAFSTTNIVTVQTHGVRPT